MLEDDQENHSGVVTHLEPEILEYEVKRVSQQTKLVEGMAFQLSYFKSLKMILLTCCTHSTSKFGKLSSGHRTGKYQFSFKPQRKAMLKECSNYYTVALTSHARKIMLKILQATLQQYMNQEFPDVQPEFRKGRGTRDQIANIRWIIEKARELKKSLLLLH